MILRVFTGYQSEHGIKAVINLALVLTAVKWAVWALYNLVDPEAAQCSIHNRKEVFHHIV